MSESFSEYAIAHEAGHAVVGQFVKIAAPLGISFFLKRGTDSQLYLGDFATTFLFPPDNEIPELPDGVKNCLCYTLAAGIAATQFSGLSLPEENNGLSSDIELMAKITSKPFESFVPYALAIIGKEEKAYHEVISQCLRKYHELKTHSVDEGRQVLLAVSELEAIFNKFTDGPAR